MQINNTTNVIEGSSNKPILLDMTYLKDQSINKVIIFSHGFKGFKDWGPFNKIAECFAKQGFVFIKFNFSYNGTTLENPCDFVDLDAFGNNNFCKELDDLGLVINWVCSKFKSPEITLFGHSRGGGISILKSSEYNKISNVISWASPADFLVKLPSYEKLKVWQQKNVAYIYNGRTKQNMPLYYQFYENCITNSERLDIQKALINMRVPHLHVQGDADTTVSIEDAYRIKNWNASTEIHIINGGNHVFNGEHPYSLKDLPKDLQEAIDVSIDFLQS